MNFLIRIGAYLNLERLHWAMQRYVSLIKVYKINKQINGKLRFITQGSAHFNISGDLSKFTIHPTSHIKSEAFIDCSGGVSIGSHFHTGKNLTIFSSNHNWRSESILPYDSIDVMKAVEIGRAVWFGSNVTILPGVIVGDGAVVAGGSVVVKNVEPGTVVGGNPAVKIAERPHESFRKMMDEQSFC
jgi:acetyltransferase-like isoleucine patch superfamily enzyme